MSLMFKDAAEFNQDISDWDVSNVINMTDIFANAIALSDENKCKINLGWSSNPNWPHSDWPNDCYQFTSKEIKGLFHYINLYYQHADLMQY